MSQRYCKKYPVHTYLFLLVKPMKRVTETTIFCKPTHDCNVHLIIFTRRFARVGYEEDHSHSRASLAIAIPYLASTSGKPVLMLHFSV